MPVSITGSSFISTTIGGYEGIYTRYINEVMRHKTTLIFLSICIFVSLVILQCYNFLCFRLPISAA